jgi:citrate synthase
MERNDDRVAHTGKFTFPDGKEVNVPLIYDPQSDSHILQASKGIEGIKIEDSAARSFHVATALSDVNGKEGKLSYRGYDINDLVNNASYEEVSHLLLRGDLPKQQELNRFKQELAEKAVIAPDVQQQLLGALKSVNVQDNTNPMELMSMVVSIMGLNESLAVAKPQERYESTQRTIAVMPTLIGLVNARLKAKDKPEEMQYSFPTAQDFGTDGQDFSSAKLLASALSGQPMASVDAKKADALNKYLILHAEHGLNLSTFTARAVDSGEAKEGAWRTTLGAMQSLAGNRHGNASNDALNNLKSILARPEDTIEAKVDSYLAESDANYKRSKEKPPGAQTPVGFVIEGIGHKIYEAPDPRAGALQTILRSCKGDLQDSRLLDVALCLQDKLKDHPRFGKREPKPYFPNVDFCSGVLLTQYLGIDERLMTSMFAVARNAGWQAHAAEHARDAKNIVRPEAIALTPAREFIPIEQREVPTEVTAMQAAPMFPAANKLLRSA